MADNIFKTLRLERTEEIVKRGAGKTIEVKQPYSVTKLAKELHLHRDTVENAEKGILLSLATLEAYHTYFEIPYSTLLGETTINDIENLNINKELGLSDNCIATVKGLSPIAHAMLNALLTNGENANLFLFNLADITYSLTEILNENGNDKSDRRYLKMQERAEELFMDYMKTITFKDLKNVLIQSERQAELIKNIRDNEYNFTE